jgi:NAD(P)-dependent dehydrogenase (short-subunit alcohol dehydrogenase family)
MSKLDGKTAVITGATSGMGLATARLLAAESAHGYITGRRKDRFDQTVAAIGADAPGRVAGVQADSGTPGTWTGSSKRSRPATAASTSSTPAPASAAWPSHWRRSRPPRSVTCSG